MALKRPKRRFKIRSFAVAATVALASVTAHADISTGLLAWYAFEDNTNDSSGSSHNGVGTDITYAPGQLGRAASFNNATSKVDVASLAGVLPVGNNPRTVAFWVNPSETTTNGNIVSWGTAAVGRRFSALMQPGGKMAMIGHFSDVDSAHTLAANTWTHVAVTYTGTRVEFYVNGALVPPTTAITLNTSASALRIGVNAPGVDNEYFGGLIDEVRIYNRVLSAADVTELFNTKAAVATPQPVPTLGLGTVGVLSLMLGGLTAWRRRKARSG